MRIGKGNIHVLKLHGTLEIEFFSCAALKTEKLENRIGCPPSASVEFPYRFVFHVLPRYFHFTGDFFYSWSGQHVSVSSFVVLSFGFHGLPRSFGSQVHIEFDRFRNQNLLAE